MSHQTNQKKVIDQIEAQVAQASLSFSTVSPVNNFDTDTRMCLTSVHFPQQDLVAAIQNQLIAPLKSANPNAYYYEPSSLHMTIKNVRTAAEIPTFSQADRHTAKSIFSTVIPQHKEFSVFFYRLLLFPTSLSLIGTTEPELDEIIFDLDTHLANANLPDDKKYINKSHFFSNITIARFLEKPSTSFINNVHELSARIKKVPEFVEYQVDSVTLLTVNAVMKRRTDIGTWNLKSKK